MGPDIVRGKYIDRDRSKRRKEVADPFSFADGGEEISNLLTSFATMVPFSFGPQKAMVAVLLRLGEKSRLALQGRMRVPSTNRNQATAVDCHL